MHERKQACLRRRAPSPILAVMLRATRGLLIVVWLAACGPSSPGSPTTVGASSSGQVADATNTGGSPTTTATSTSADPTSTTGTTTTVGATSGPGTDMTDTGGSTGDPAACLATTGQGSETGTDETTGGPGACPAIAGQPCTAPIDCTGEFCGSHLSMLDAQGCPRATCKVDADCSAGEGCMLENSLHGPVTCVDEQGACSCTLGEEPVSGVCLPEALLPAQLPEHCASLTSEAACNVFNTGGWDACHWEPTQLFCDGHCAPGAQSGACIAFFYVGDGCFGCFANQLGRAYRRPHAGGTEVFFNKACGDEPHGWQNCDDVNDPLCQCLCLEE